jgi:hypothetical protein
LVEWMVLVGEPKYSEKTCPDDTLSTTNPTCQTRARTRTAPVGSQRLTASTIARPWTIWRRENSWPYRDSNSDPSVVQPVASRYTDYAIPAPANHYTYYF